MADLLDTDLVLVQRGGASYKMTGSDLKASIVPPISVATPSITSPSDGAIDQGPSPTFTSSPFSSTGTTHVSSDWQVALDTDPTFASPVAESLADTANKEQWSGATLTANTDYLVRVRYNGTGVSSAWSAAVAFKTKASFISAATPGDIYTFDGTSTPIAPLTAPTKFINVAATNTDGVYGIGLDGQIYKTKLPSTTFAVQTDFTPEAGKTAVDMWCRYSAVGWGGAQPGFAVLYSDGSIQSGTINSYPGAAVKSLIKLGGVVDVVAVVDVNDAIWAAAFSGLPQSMGTHDFAQQYTWENVGIVMPAGVKVKSVAGAMGSYDAPALVILGDNGKLYSSCKASAATDFATLGFKTTGTNAALAEETTFNTGRTFIELATIGSAYGTYSVIAALTSNRELWMAGGNDALFYKPIGAAPFAQKLTAVNTLPVSGYNVNYFYLVDQTSTAQYGAGSLALSPVSMGGVTPAGSWTSVGTLPGSLNKSGGPLYIIVPS